MLIVRPIFFTPFGANQKIGRFPNLYGAQS